MARGKLLSHLYVDKDLSIRREPLSIGRIKLTKTLIGKNYSKVILINLLMCLFALPAILLIGMAMPQLETAATKDLNFSGNIGIGYPNVFDDPLIGKMAIYDIRIQMLVLLIPCFTLFGLGAAGLFYCVRNMAWGAPMSIGRHFWRGIKLYWFRFVLAFTYLGGLVSLCGFSVINVLKQNLTIGADAGSWVLLVFSLLLGVCSFIFLMFYLPMVVTYKFKERHYIKNSIIFAITLIPTTLINLVFMGLPFLLILSQFTSMLFMMFMTMFGVVFYSLWVTNYGHFAFDNFIKTIYEMKQQEESKKSADVRRKAQKGKTKQQPQQRTSYKKKSK